ncbi:hypothetical protein DFH09DRAFT_1042106 [Mycena vulgaris]|nr:hypothetical protein DFH09DRAFT_1042106 [Mycena vulgaris]
MDDEPPFEPDFHSESSLDEDGPRNNQYTGAFFPGAQNFAVAGGKFKNITNITQAAPTVPSDFRTIPIGDLDLRHEMPLNGRSGLVNRWQGRNSARRVYSARVHGCKAKMTAAVYQGENGEEEWREDISRYAWLRHPNLVQLFATASSSGIHAAIFHDDLVPAQNRLDQYRGSNLSTVYIYSYLVTEFCDLRLYTNSVLGTHLYSSQCTMWIRCSTGRLCVDLTPPAHVHLWLYTSVINLSSSLSSSSEPPEDSQIIESTPLAAYHVICSLHLGHSGQLLISPDASVQLGAIISCAAGTGIEYSTMIAGIPENMFEDCGWWSRDNKDREPLFMGDDGWTRVNSSDIADEQIHRTILNQNFPSAWLAQANYIFNRLGITSNYKDYVFVDHIQCRLTLSDTDRIPAGYLFLCPLRNFESETPAHFRLPECPAYWSLGPSGGERLSTEEAEELGFPHFDFTMHVYGDSWDELVYRGIHQFHEGKGYDPYSQDVARELGYPLYEVASELESCELLKLVPPYLLF